MEARLSEVTKDEVSGGAREKREREDDLDHVGKDTKEKRRRKDDLDDTGSQDQPKRRRMSNAYGLTDPKPDSLTQGRYHVATGRG